MENQVNKVKLATYSDIDFFVRKYRTDTKLNPLHFHEFLQINYVSEGECIHFLEGKSYTVKKGDAFVIPPNVCHYIKDSGGKSATIYEIEFSTDFINSSLIFGNQSPEASNNIFWDFAYLSPFLVDADKVQPFFTLSEQLQDKIELIFADMLYEFTHRESDFKYVLSGLCLPLLIYIGREYKKAISISGNSSEYSGKKQNIINAIQYINEHYSENLTVGEVAKSQFISVSYFKSLFKHFTSKTFVEYLNNVRISKAAILLKKTDMKIIDIALETGFNYVNHFNKTFKSIMKMTPGEYRKLNRH